jgi:outer membrane protein assembly factor BamB
MNRPPLSEFTLRNVRPSPERPADARPAYSTLLADLLGPEVSDLEPPGLADLIGSVLGLCEGQRRRTILPLASSTGEFALVRRGEQVLLSYYDSGLVPQIFVRDRALALPSLLAACTRAALEMAEHAQAGSIQKAARRLHERCARTAIKPDDLSAPIVVTRRGGALVRSEAALAFGFSAQIPQLDSFACEHGTRADVHALLFDGELWGYVHGRRIVLARGPIFPAIARMMNAARSIVEAWESQRPLSLRLRAGEFGIGVRLDKAGQLALTLAAGNNETLTLANTSVPDAVSPMLKLATDLARTVVSADRSQAKNLRLAALRDEARALRRVVRTKTSRTSFVNRDPDFLRASAATTSVPREVQPANDAGPTKLRLSLRWHAELDGLDAAATFLCGDRLVVASQRAQVALSRDDGEPLWMRNVPAQTSLMAGTSLLCVAHDGEVSLIDVTDGEAYARCRIAPRVAGAMSGVFVGTRQTPPLMVLTEGRDRLVAIDVRSGEPRWRFRSRGRGNFRFTRAGRILLVVSGDSTLDAIDVASGEVCWRWSDPGRIVLAPSVTRDMAFAVSGNPATERGALLALDLFSGQLVFRKELSTGPLTSPIASEGCVILCVHDSVQPKLVGFDTSTGRERFNIPDPGLCEGGAPLMIDGQLVINAPNGHLSAVDLQTGKLVYQYHLADPVRDDMPRRLEPVLRGGALFIPSACVHVVRPSDGRMIGGPISEGLIPDFMRVDERGWLYLAEESGHLEAYAPAPNLRLIKS